MEKFTKEMRQQIIEDFCKRHDSDFDPRMFEQEVRETGKTHPAYDWFEWDKNTAATEYRIWQARTFARDLRVSFKVEDISRAGAVSVRYVEAPMLISPMADRQSGGGYYLTDLDNPAHMAELCQQAATDLARWMRRYEAALAFVGGSVTLFDNQRQLLASFPASRKEAAE